MWNGHGAAAIAATSGCRMNSERNQGDTVSR